MAIGWKKIGNYWYYFQSWGGMYRDTFVEYDGNTYYLASNGVMGVGWMKIDGNWYYFYNWGGAVKGWKKLTYPTEYGGDEYWNYFNSSGVFITDSDVEGCSHGRSTFSDYHLITGIPFTYYTNLGTSQDANIKKGADAWGSKYLSRTTNKNKATLTFEYDSFIYNTQNARTLFQIDLSVVDHVTTNFDGAIIQFNKDKGIASASTVAHEIGHVLGLSHRISEKSSIMYYLSEGRKVSTPQTIDFSNAAHVN